MSKKRLRSKNKMKQNSSELLSQACILISRLKNAKPSTEILSHLQNCERMTEKLRLDLLISKSYTENQEIIGWVRKLTILLEMLFEIVEHHKEDSDVNKNLESVDNWYKEKFSNFGSRATYLLSKQNCADQQNEKKKQIASTIDFSSIQTEYLNNRATLPSKPSNLIVPKIRLQSSSHVDSHNISVIRNENSFHSTTDFLKNSEDYFNSLTSFSPMNTPSPNLISFKHINQHQPHHHHQLSMRNNSLSFSTLSNSQMTRNKDDIGSIEEKTATTISPLNKSPTRQIVYDIMLNAGDMSGLLEKSTKNLNLDFKSIPIARNPPSIEPNQIVKAVIKHDDKSGISDFEILNGEETASNDEKPKNPQSDSSDTNSRQTRQKKDRISHLNDSWRIRRNLLALSSSEKQRKSATIASSSPSHRPSPSAANTLSTGVTFLIADTMDGSFARSGYHPTRDYAGGANVRAMRAAGTHGNDQRQQELEELLVVKYLGGGGGSDSARSGGGELEQLMLGSLNRFYPYSQQSYRSNRTAGGADKLEQHYTEIRKITTTPEHFSYASQLGIKIS